MFYLTTLLASLYVNADKILIGGFFGATGVGYYSTAMKVVLLALALTTSLSAVLLPRMAHYHATGNATEFHAKLDQSLRFILMLALPLCAGMYLLSDLVIQALAGADFQPAAATLRILSVNVISIGLANLIGIQLLCSTGREKLYLLSLAGGLVVMGAGVALGFARQHNGVALAIVFANLTQMLLQAGFAWGMLKKVACRAAHLKYVLATAVMAALLLACQGLPVASAWVRLIGGIGVGALAYFVMLLILRDALTLEMWRRAAEVSALFKRRRA